MKKLLIKQFTHLADMGNDGTHRLQAMPFAGANTRANLVVLVASPYPVRARYGLKDDDYWVREMRKGESTYVVDGYAAPSAELSCEKIDAGNLAAAVGCGYSTCPIRGGRRDESGRRRRRHSPCG